MRRSTIKWFVCAVFASLLIIACAGTKLTQTQVDEAHRGKPVSDVLVIGVTFKEDVRRSFENKFVAQLKAAGIDAVSSANVIPIPADQKLKKEDILKVVDEYGNDAVIITHLVGIEEKQASTPPGQYSGDYYGRYYSLHNYHHDSRYYITHTLVRLETNLYDVNTEKLIWSAQSETMDADSSMQIIDDVIKLVIKDLQKNKLLPPK